MGTLATLLQRFDDQSSVRGKQFERICRWYLTTDPLFRRELKRVWLWDEWPRRWGADAGMDLVAEARDGGLWAIQAKAYDPRYGIKKSDVDTFLSESARPEFKVPGAAALRGTRRARAHAPGPSAQTGR